MPGLKKTGMINKSKMFSLLKKSKGIISAFLFVLFCCSCNSENDSVSTINKIKKEIPLLNTGTDSVVSAFMDGPEKNPVKHITVQETESEPSHNLEDPKKFLDRKLADRILAFTNRALEKLQTEWREPAEMFYNLGHIYLRIYQIPARLTMPPRKRQDLVPAKGLFSIEEETVLTKSMDDMDRALASSLAHYRQLEKYVLDSSLKDNGKEGKKIVRMLEHDRKAYIKAENEWIKIVNHYAAQAEEALLLDHPLRRQARAASRIMRILQEVSARYDTPDEREFLSARQEEIVNLIRDGGKPPFRANPQIERLFRIFLKNVSVYSEVLRRAALEGMYDIQKRELRMAASACTDTYNNFIKSFNENL